MRILRDLAHSSRVLLLLELRRKPASTLRPLAESVGLTQQAVSGYMRRLEADGLVRRADGVFRVTPAGEGFLAEEIASLKSFADRAARELVKLEVCVAIAGARVRRGDKVGLFMKGGRLLALPGRKSPSWGVAKADASPQQDLLVGDLRGIVQIPAASLTIVELPSGKDGGSAAADAAWLRSFAAGRKVGWFAALDEVGEGALRRLGLPWEFEFAPLESAAAAVSRGVSPVFVGARETVGLLVSALEAAKAAGRPRRLPYAVVRAKRRQAPKQGRSRR